jgi:ketosteroid isomerase-like protein
MAEHPNVRVIREAYVALGAGDFAGGLKNVAPDAVFHIGGSGPLSGAHRGSKEIETFLLGLVALTAGDQQLDISTIYADDEHGVVVLRETASRPDGATLDVDEVHLLGLDHRGRITELWDLPSDPEAHDRFFDGL